MSSPDKDASVFMQTLRLSRKDGQLNNLSVTRALLTLVQDKSVFLTKDGKEQFTFLVDLANAPSISSDKSIKSLSQVLSETSG